MGMRALNAPDRKKAGIRQRSTWAVRYSMSVSIPLVSIWLMMGVIFFVSLCSGMRICRHH